MNRYLRKIVKPDPLEDLKKIVEEAKKDPEKLKALNSSMSNVSKRGHDPNRRD